ncbi:multi-sensor signal transduction histidine kinase [Chthoniobacter flavus Ellin428]|uniref:histidine kinase n=2 Tax=Chthoniobacter flavus TaxID=191863 RepID=B4D663_9BACT|nr:multi-sensor signal transduction histidine kinase [Chthoniobacter flavus Ellin428]TCO88215.1 PAS domain S-box-containing protein [Chthoniobacter flavus]
MKTVERDALPMWLRESADVKAAFDEHAIVVIVDAQERITFVSERFCAISQLSGDELVGQDYRAIVSERYPHVLLYELRDCMAHDSRWRGEIQFHAKDGTSFWISATIVPLLDEEEKLRQFVVIGADITEQKRVENELSEMHRLQRLLADLSARFVAVPSAQVDAAIQTTQSLVGEALGLDRSMLWQLGEHGADMSVTHYWQRDGLPPLPPDLSMGACLPWIHDELLRGGCVCFSTVGELPARAARDVQVFSQQGTKSCLTFPLIANGKTFGALAFATLQAERKWRDDVIAELKLVAQIIGNVVARQRSEMREEQLRDELAHAMRIASLGELAAAIAHELNQPLAAILSNAQAARRFLENGESDPDELHAILDDIVRDDKRAGGVVHNLRAMVRKHPATRESYSLNDLVIEVLELLRGEMIGERVGLHLSLAPSLPPVAVARVELQQVLVNLFINATQAMNSNASGDRAIDVETRTEAETVVVRIRDRGHGVPPDRLSHIFDPFFSTKADGLGMGLSICRRIIESHGGRIEARNHREIGAIFSFSLPIAAIAAR